MDSVITAAARALAAGDPLGALTRVALRDDAPALALRGTAMAQLGDFARARSLLRRAARAYGAREALSCARCTLAEAEVALASRNLNWSSLEAARAIFEAHGDLPNAAYSRYLEIRYLVLTGRLEDAESSLIALDTKALPAMLETAHELTVAALAVRRIQARKARGSLIRAAAAARRSGIPALVAEVETASLQLTTPAARLITRGNMRELRLEQIESLLASKTLVVDACRFRIHEAATSVELARRPVVFTLARLLAEAWPADVSREVLAAKLFRARRIDESYRARLRVEVGRLRRVLGPLGKVVATRQGFAMVPRHAHAIAVLTWPVEHEYGAVLALLADGESWSSSTLALALSVSVRTAQRALESLARGGKVRALGRGRARRWLIPVVPGFPTVLLLNGAVQSD